MSDNSEQRERPRMPCTLTLAISLQLLPTSLICFNRCSSAGVHGVLVRLFFATGVVEVTVVELDSGTEVVVEEPSGGPEARRFFVPGVPGAAGVVGGGGRVVEVAGARATAEGEVAGDAGEVGGISDLTEGV
jgi:hypothetical protein